MKVIILAFSFFFLTIPAFSQNQIIIPDTITGESINLTLQHGSMNFFPGLTTNTMGANGNILGPTIILNKNQQVTLNVNNQLMDTTTIHWHGMHVSPQDDGGPHIIIPPGETWSPAFTILDHASSYWYHPHLHHHTNEHVSKGISGFIIVRDEQESGINLPRSYGVDDFPLVVQTKSFDLNNQILFDNVLDTTVMVNATIDPYLNVPAQVVRMRLLNGSSVRAFNFGFTDNLTFYQVGSDGGLLSQSVPLTRLLLAPGERAEILINFSSHLGQNLQLMNYGSEIPNGIYGAVQPGIAPGQTIPGYNLNYLNGNNFSVLTINVGESTPNPITSIPFDLAVHNPWQVNEADTSRVFTFTSTMGPTAIQGPFRINGVFFDMNIINEHIAFNNIEIWELQNQTPIAHPFHIHNIQFYIVDINGNPPPANLSGRKDVILVRANSTVRFITKFEDFYDDDFPYMYHCHMLNHEEEGMMGQFIVQSPENIPVELISFSASVTGNNINLKWITASEINNYGFEVEKSQISNIKSQLWEKIGFVKGKGTTNGIQNYNFTDANLSSGIYKYRLKQMDFNGSFEYSYEIKVDVKTPAVYSLEQNYPNPFNPSTNIKFSIAEDGQVKLILYNVIGEEVKILLNEFKQEGSYDIEFDASSLKSGIYFYKLETAKFNQTRKMILIR